MNILMANRLFMSPKLYSTFLLWFLSELYEQLPEVGDLEKPKIVFFFDEAHVLFQDVPDVLEEKIELIVRLIRSKGVGVYFVTQNPTDLPNAILSQLGNKIQHALRAFTPKEQKTVKAVAETFRQLDGEELDKKLTELKVGEALVSFLDPEGIPGYVQQVMIYPPESKMGILDPLVKEEKINRSLLYYKYSEAIDRESSYEQLQRLSEIKAIELEENEELAARDREKAEQLKQLEKERHKRTNPAKTVEQFPRFDNGQIHEKSDVASRQGSRPRHLARYFGHPEKMKTDRKDHSHTRAGLFGFFFCMN